jgi:phenylpyruvate tautomerase PptA (4-oxalocrotonate tautomerase family)
LLRLQGVNIRFISTLTAEDENRLAPGILKAVSALAGMFPIRFVVKLDTVDGRTYCAGNHSQAANHKESSEPVMPPGSPIES